MKPPIRNLLATIFVAASLLQTHAQGTLVFDQQSAMGPVTVIGNGNADGLYIQEDSPLMQSFIPSLSAIGFVQLEFQDVPNNGINGATVYVNLWTGSPNINSATLLGSTIPVFMPNGFATDSLFVAGVTNFLFPTPIVLTSGKTYYLQPVVLSGDDPWAIVTIGDTYANGRLYGKTGGYFQPSTDFWFREGIVVPEPSALAFIGLIWLLFFSFRRCSRSLVLLLSGALFTASALPVHAAGDSVVQATADAAGLTRVSPAALSGNDTFWVITTGFDGDLTTLPYPFLPPKLATSPTYSVVDGIFLVDATGGQLVPASAGQLSTAQASAAVQTQAETIAALIDEIQLSPGGGDGTNGGYQANGFTLIIDTNSLWLEASNQAPYLGLRLHNTVGGDNYQLLPIC